MKIDLSKYPPGTKFQQKNKSKTPMILLGQNPINHKYVVTWKSSISGKTHYQEYNQDGCLSEVGHLISDHNLIGLYPSDKYLISYLTEQDEVDTIVLPIANTKALNEAVLLPIISRKTSSMLDMIPGCSERAVKILSWSKIEE